MGISIFSRLGSGIVGVVALSGAFFRTTAVGRPIRWSSLGWLIAWAAFAGGGARVHGAEGVAGVPGLAPTNAILSAEYVAQRLTALSNRTDLATGVRSNALALYHEAEQRLADARRHAEEAGRFRSETTNAPAVLSELEKRLAAPTGVVVAMVETNAALADLEQRVTRVDGELAKATKEQEDLAQEPTRRTARLAELTRLAGETTAIRERLAQEAAAPQPADLDAELRQAGRDLTRARYQARDAEAGRYEDEQAYLRATAEVIRLRSDLTRRRVMAITQEREASVAALNRRREQESLEASRKAAEATRRAEALNEPWIVQLARTNSVLAGERSTLAERLQVVSSQLDSVNSNRLARRESFQGVRERVDAAERAGLSRNFAIGMLLRRQQASLRGQGDYRGIAKRQSTYISDAQIAQFAAVDLRRAIEPVETTAVAMVGKLFDGADPERSALLQQETRSLLVAQRDTLVGLIRDYDTYLGLLFRYQSALEESAAAIDEYSTYLGHRILWIRSAEPIRPEVVFREAQAILGALRSPAWPKTIRTAIETFQKEALDLWPVCLGLAVLIAGHKQFGRRLVELAAKARQGRNTSIRPTLYAVVYTVLRVLPLPLVFGLVGWVTWKGTLGVESTLVTLGPALMMGGAIVGVLGFLREICQPGGLAHAHFRVPEADLRVVNRCLVIGWWGLPVLGVLNRFLESEVAEGVSNRLVFIPTVVIGAVLAHLVFRSHGGIGFAPTGVGGPVRWTARLGRRMAHATLVMLPLLFGLASAMGYNYSARQLWMRFLGSFFVALGLKLGRELLLRSIYLTRRRLAMEHALKQRTSGDGEGAEASPEAMSLDDNTQSELLVSMGQAGRLLDWTYAVTLAFCLYAIWSGTLPALKALDQIPLWSRGGVAAAASGDTIADTTALSAATGDALSGSSAGASDVSAGGRRVGSGAATTKWFVSVWDLILVVLLIVVVATAATNLPGFLEMAVFSHVKLERGTGYAVTTTLRYAIILMGVIVTAKGLGLEWSQVQWLAAAVTLGIGFGLQEIFANFVSGLILLLERPVRVGDIVTVGEVSGLVTRIQIRATTVRDADNRELVLPNKELITGRFVNWTLSDSVTRIVCGVGIAYESDIRQAQRLMLDLARKHPAVLGDPPPVVTFDSFGESTLNLSLRVHVGRPDLRSSTMSDLNAGILEAFRQNKIEIAFPQRDLNVRVLPQELTPPSPPRSDSQTVLREDGSSR